jgi:hypothetical protein
MTKVKLSDLIDTIQCQPEEYECYINLKTGEIIEISDEVRSVVEHGDEDYPDWMEDEIQMFIAFDENEDDYLALPTQNDLNEYKMMENFAEEQTDANIQTQLLKALQGKGAFFRFKDEVTKFGLAAAWYQYRNECYKEYLIDWCEENELEFE